MTGNTNAARDSEGQRVRPFSAALRTYLYADKKKRLDAVIGALFVKAESGDVVAIKEIADRIEGKVALQIQSTTTHTVIDADLLSEAGKLLQIISGQATLAPLVEIVDPEASEAVDAEIIEEITDKASSDG